MDCREPGCFSAASVQQAHVSKFTLTLATLLSMCVITVGSPLQEQYILHLTANTVLRHAVSTRFLSLRHFSQLNIMFVGGPNTRKDYHIEEGEEVRDKLFNANRAGGH